MKAEGCHFLLTSVLVLSVTSPATARGLKVVKKLLKAVARPKVMND